MNYYISDGLRVTVSDLGRLRLAPCLLTTWTMTLALPGSLAVAAWHTLTRTLALRSHGVEAERGVDVVDRPTRDLLRLGATEVRGSFGPDARHDLAQNDPVERLVRDVVVELEPDLDEHADGTEGAVDDALLLDGLAVRGTV